MPRVILHSIQTSLAAPGFACVKYVVVQFTLIAMRQHNDDGEFARREGGGESCGRLTVSSVHIILLCVGGWLVGATKAAEPGVAAECCERMRT